MKRLKGLLLFGAFALLYVLERKQPLRKQIESPAVGTGRTLAIASVAGAAMNFVEKPVAERLTEFVDIDLA